jgi:pimeloyl-ACP methyl ester carboxylesterase
MRIRIFCLGTSLLLLGSVAGRADLIIFKDGFVLEGKVKQQQETIIEPGAGVFSAPKDSFWIDDGARRIFFSRKQVAEPSKTDKERYADAVVLMRAIRPQNQFKVPSGRFGAISPWNEKWDRTLTLDALRADGKIKPLQLAQHLSILTPYFMRVDCRDYRWAPHYLTRELERESVRGVLLSHPDLKLTGAKTDVAKRFRLFQFFVQAGWFDMAQAELDDIEKELPEEKTKITDARTQLKKAVLVEFVDLLELANKNGRHQWVQARLPGAVVQATDENLAARVRTLQTAYEASARNLAQARNLLNTLPAEIPEGAQQNFFQEVATTILSELTQDNVGRLEPFVSLAKLAQNQKALNQTPDYTPAQLLSAGLSGWVMGGTNAEAKVEHAQRLWKARTFALAYLATHDAQDRQQLLAAYQRSQPLACDEIAQLLRFLPPTDPFELTALTLGPWAAGALPLPYASLFWALYGLQQTAPNSQYTLQVELPWRSRRGASYLVQLPPEYHHGRNYPVLFVLHEATEKPEDILRRFSALAAQHGYLLVAPQWNLSSREGYNYSAIEHLAVTETLLDLRRRFQVDSDRVFLAGFGEGANMAFDVGLAHPDLFAGVVVLAGRPQYFARMYWPNAQYLPFYVVSGDLDADGYKDNRAEFDRWLPPAHGYPSLFVLYKGRGQEWFGGELPNIFDWMDRKKREAPTTTLGRSGNGTSFGDEFQSMRPADNHFYWLSGDDMNERQKNDRRGWNKVVVPASFQAQVSGGSQINVNVRGFKKITVWLGEGTIDYEKPVTVYLNQRLALANRKVTPNLGTLLEDVYQRGDRQRRFWAKLELSQ